VSIRVHSRLKTLVALVAAEAAPGVLVSVRGSYCMSSMSVNRQSAC
jgi:hypothetical protein